MAGATATPVAASAHTGAPPAPHDLATAWNLQPLLLVVLIGGGWAYAVGVRLLWARAGVGRGVGRGRVAAFAGGMLTLIVALVSPLDALSGALFSAHMAQHLLLILLAAPLLALGEPETALLWALPRGGRRRVGHWWKRSGARAVWHALARLPVAWLVSVIALWAWHVPALYQAALGNEALHAAEHASFVLTAALVWWALLHGKRGRPAYGAGVIAVFGLALQGGALGALMTFAAAPWYPAYAGSVAPWGLSPLDDQQLAGLIMWIPAGVTYLLAACLLFVGWLNAVEREDQARERGATARLALQPSPPPEGERPPAALTPLNDPAAPR